MHHSFNISKKKKRAIQSVEMWRLIFTFWSCVDAAATQMEDDLEMELELAGEFPHLDEQLDDDEQEPMPPDELSDARPETDTAGRSSWHPVGEIWRPNMNKT